MSSTNQGGLGCLNLFRMEFAHVHEINPSLNKRGRELALIAIVQRKMYDPTIYLDGNETAR